MDQKSSGRRRPAAVSRRGFLGGCAVAGLALAVGGCATNRPTPPSPAPSRLASPTPAATLPTPRTAAATAAPTPIPASPTPVPRTVTLWTADNSTPFLQGIESVGRAFTDQHPNIRVRVVGGQADFGKLIEALALEQGPDVFDPGALAPFATRGVLRSLDDRVGQDGIQPANYRKVMWENGRWQGKTFGVPALDHGPELGFVVNRSLVSADPGAVDTWDKLFGFGLAATQKQGQRIDRLGLDPLNGVGGLLDTVASLVGQDWYDPVARKVRLADSNYLAYLEHLQVYYRELGVAALDDFRARFPSVVVPGDSGVGLGKEAAVLAGCRVAWELSKGGSKDFRVGWVPSQPGAKVQRIGGRFLAIPAVARQPDDGWQVLAYVASEAGNGRLFETTGRAAWTNSFLAGGQWKAAHLLGFFAESLSGATSLTGQPIRPVAGLAQVQWQAAIHAIVVENRAPADVLKAAQDAVDRELDRLAKATPVGQG